MVLIALNLRPSVTGVGPLLQEMQRSLQVSTVWVAVLTALPLFCFAGGGVVAPWLSRRIGLGRAISVAFIAVAVGLVVRVLAGPSVVIGGTAVAMIGIAFLNVLLPVVVMASFPARMALMSGIYTAALQGGGALGSAVTPAIADWSGGWRPALGGWAALTLLGLLAWLVVARRFDWGLADTPTQPEGRSLLRNRLAWTVTMFFACQAFMAFVALNWLPAVFMSNGLSEDDAGLLVGLTSVIPVPVSLLISSLAVRQPSQSGWIVGLTMVGVAAVVGLTIAPAAAPLLWCVLYGLAMALFSLALLVITLRTDNAADTAQLSGMAQGFGYLLGGTGPFLFGLLHELSDGWTVPWLMVLVVLLAQAAIGAAVGRDRHI